MSFNDWKAALQGLDITEGAEPTDGQTTPQADLNNPEGKDALSPQEPATLHVVMERKGRGGKTATIITGFTIADNEVAGIAARLKSRLGTGGSARGGEILIQGDRRADVARMLREWGYKVRG